MTTLSAWIDLQDPESLGVFTSLLGHPGERVGVYESIHHINELLERLQHAEVDEVPSLWPQQPQLLKVYDLGTGLSSSVSNVHIRRLVDDKRIKGDTPVHFKYLYGGLFLFLLTSDFEEKYVRCEHTYLALNKTKKQPWLARIGAFTPVNAVWFQPQYDGRISTLDKVLKIPYLKSFSITTLEDFSVDDITY